MACDEKDICAAEEKLSAYKQYDPDFPGFRYIRYYWKNIGPRAGITAKVKTKLNPAGHTAFKHDVLLPERACGEYMDLEHLLARCDATFPRSEKTAYAQFTIDLPEHEGWHVGWERVRSWAYDYFVRQYELPVIVILHATGLAGSSNQPHIHLIIPPRRLGANGFGAHVRGVGTDDGFMDALLSWLDYST